MSFNQASFRAQNPTPFGSSVDQNTMVSFKRNQLLELMSADDISAVAQHARTVQLKKNQPLLHAGEAPDHVYFPHGGLVSLRATMADGKTVQIASVGLEGAVGLAEACESRAAVADAAVLISSQALRVPARELAKLAQNSASFRTLASQYDNACLTQLAELVACTAFHDVQARFSRYLLQIRDCLGCAALPVTQETVSEMLGVRRTTVSLIAGTLRARGIISYQRGSIQISDAAALERLACSCYHSSRCMTAALVDDAQGSLRPAVGSMRGMAASQGNRPA